MAVSITATRVFGPETPIGQGRAEIDVAGVTGNVGVAVYLNPPTGPALQQFGFDAPGTVHVGALDQAQTYFISVGHVGPPSSVATTTAAVPVYVAPADPTVESQPASVTAAHLPMLATLRADPVYQGGVLVPAVLLCVVEVYRGSAWVGAGRIREVCDAAGLARVDMSEYVKTQFSETPPNESGTADTALGIRWRVRYGRASAFDGTAGDEAGTYGGLAVNAAEVVNPGLLPYPLTLGPASPYAGVPTGAARFRSTVNTAADAVTNVNTVPVDATLCAARQFVWLHPSGAWCWGFFSGKHAHNDETGDGVVVRRAGGVRRYVSRGDVGDVGQVYSDKVDFTTYEYLRTIRTSVQVYERLASGLYVPVLLEAGSYPGYQETDKTFEVNFTARYPLQVRQTQ